MRSDHFKFAVVVSANAEWKAVKSGFLNARIENSPYGECFFEQVEEEIVLFCHGGWGKVAAAASTQYVIDHFNPEHLINIGTCGGIEGRIQRFDVVVPVREFRDSNTLIRPVGQRANAFLGSPPQRVCRRLCHRRRSPGNSGYQMATRVLFWLTE